VSSHKSLEVELSDRNKFNYLFDFQRSVARCGCGFYVNRMSLANTPASLPVCSRLAIFFRIFNAACVVDVIVLIFASARRRHQSSSARTCAQQRPLTTLNEITKMTSTQRATAVARQQKSSVSLAGISSEAHQLCFTAHFALSSYTVLDWFESYLRGRVQEVRSTTSSSMPSQLLYGVPQGSVLGPILFLLYTADLLQLIKRRNLVPHEYADDTQISGFCESLQVDDLTGSMSACVDDVSGWMKTNRLQMNEIKTELLWCASARRQHVIPSGPVRIGNVSVQPVSAVRDLGVYIDADVSMRTHVTTTVRACFASLRQLRSVRRSLPRQALLTLARALVVSKVDYCISVLAGISESLQNWLQSALNAAARLVCSARKSEHITPLLRELPWLLVPERIQFRLCVLAYRCVHGTAPAYLADSLQLTADAPARRRLRSTDTMTLQVDMTLYHRGPGISSSLEQSAANSLLQFRRETKAHLFRQSFLD